METLPQRYLALIKWTETVYRNFVEKVNLDYYETAINNFSYFPGETYPENHLLLWYEADISLMNESEIKHYHYNFKDCLIYLRFMCLCIREDIKKEVAEKIPEIIGHINRMYDELTNHGSCIKAVIDRIHNFLPALQNDKKDSFIQTRFLPVFDALEKEIHAQGYINSQRRWMRTKKEIALLADTIHKLKWFRRVGSTPQAMRTKIRLFFEARYNIDFQQQYRPVNIGDDKTFAILITSLRTD